MASPLRLGLVGAGGIAWQHVAAYQSDPRVQLVGIADLHLPSAERMAASVTGCRAFDSYEEMFSLGLDAVDICVPHDGHLPVALAAFAAGLDVVCEKPIARTVAEGDRIVAAAQSADRRFFVSFNQRFIPAHEKAAELIRDGAIGKPLVFQVTVIGYDTRMFTAGNWKGSWAQAGGGVLVDTGMHVIDLARYWFGDPVAVTADARRLSVPHAEKGDDTSILVLHYPRMTCTMNLTYAAGGNSWHERKEVIGTNGTLRMVSEAAEPLTIIRSSGVETIPVEHDANWSPLSLRRSLHHLIGCLIDGTQPRITAADARAALRIAEAAYQSSLNGCRVPLVDTAVSLDEAFAQAPISAPR